MNLFKIVLKMYLKFITLFHDWFLDRLSIRAYKGLHPKNIFKFRAEFFLEQVNSNSRIIDVACGTAQTLKILSPKIKQGMGIDLNPENIEKCRKDLNTGNLTFICGDIFEIEYGKLDFNTVVLSHILEHIENPTEFLRKFLGKTLLICVPSQENWRAQLKKSLGISYFSDKTHFREYTRTMLQTELLQAGFAVSQIGFNSEGEITCVANQNG